MDEIFCVIIGGLISHIPIILNLIENIFMKTSKAIKSKYKKYINSKKNKKYYKELIRVSKMDNIAEVAKFFDSIPESYNVYRIPNRYITKHPTFYRFLLENNDIEWHLDCFTLNKSKHNEISDKLHKEITKAKLNK